MSAEQSSPIKLLLVDDEEDLVVFLAQRLRKRQIEVATATDGAGAVALAEKEKFHVAVVDLKMPDMNGIEVMDRLKNIQPYVEVIMLTGHGSQDSAYEAGRLQAFRYLLKPYDFDELHELIRAAADFRRVKLHADYDKALKSFMESSPSTRDLLEETEKLRREYEQD